MRKTSAWAYVTLAFLSSACVASAALPEPPYQRQPWTPPVVEGIPESVVKITAALFDAGLADPRGGAYREIQLSGSDWGAEGAAQTHGWVFAEGYAVCWNGLVYQVRSIGASADLVRDVDAIVNASPSTTEVYFTRWPPQPDIAFWVSIESAGGKWPVAIALLLRLGRHDLARHLWRSPDSFSKSGVIPDREPMWTRRVAAVWLGAAFHRLINERTGGNDKEAVEIGQSLVTWEQRWRTAREQMPASAATDPAGYPDLSFLKPLPRLLADSQRRLQQPARPNLDFKALWGIAGKDGAASSAFLGKSQSARIADLIDRLEDVAARKFIWPGWLDLMHDPISTLLAKEGEAAVGPLLDVYEHDQRLTRSVDFRRPWHV